MDSPNHCENSFTEHYFGFTLQDFYISCLEDANTIIRRNLKNLVFENTSEIENFVDETTTKWLEKSEEAFKRLKKEAERLFYINSDFLSNCEDESIVALKEETENLFQLYLKEKLLLEKIKTNKELISFNASEIENKIKAIKKLEENHKQLEQFSNYHTTRLLKSDIVSTRYEKFSFSF